MNTVKYYASKKFSDLSAALSHKLYGEIRGVNMRWVPLTSCDEYIIAGGLNLASAGYKAHVWCSGYTATFGRTSRPHKIHSLRGPLSQSRAKNHMNINAPCAGDPLLLIADMYEITDETIIPCVFTKKKLSHEIVNNMGTCRHITISDSLETILTSIKNSPFVITDIFEGLVFADAYHVPSTYISGGSIPFVIKDYLENFDYGNQSICDNFPENLASFTTFNNRNTAQLKNILLKTLPTI